MAQQCLKHVGVWIHAPYRIATRAAACKRLCLASARTCTVPRGGPLGGQHGKDFSPPKKVQRLHRITPRMALDPLRRCSGLGLKSTLGTFIIKYHHMFGFVRSLPRQAYEIISPAQPPRWNRSEDLVDSHVAAAAPCLVADVLPGHTPAS